MFESTVGEEEIEMCIQKYLILSSFLCRRGYGGETVSNCEVDWIGVYLGHFQGGLRLPLHPFIIAFLFDIGALPCQLGTNVWSLLNAFITLYGKMNVIPTLEYFYELFRVKLSKDNGYYLNPRTNRKVFQLPTSNHHVHSEFFLARKTNQAAWEFPSVF